MKPYRNRKLLDLARGQECVACGADDGTVVAAHSNLPEHGKGMGQKGHDGMIAFLCARCHAEYDQGKGLSREERAEFIARAILKTYMRMWEQGLIRVA